MPSSHTSGDDVDMTPILEENTQPAEPPSRLAARFYRKSSGRRRSSAHSSRCSSLSSLSRSSALSCHGGPQSTHIAQHLRRASIIESRKARLADRAAHAERVRLRAAAAKAAPRATYSEEKALAAQAAREKLLAEITARCEEEVRRAKKIAEETREKRAAEDARRRDELEEKYAEAARRRSLFQSNTRRPRTISLAAVEERKINPVVLRKLTQVAAAKVIQRSWRSWHRRKVAQDLLELDLSIPRLTHMAFEDVTKFLADENSIMVAKRALKQLDLLDSSSEEADRGSVRVFLSAFMILAHPVQAFSHGGNEPQEQELNSKAQALIESFDKCNSTFAKSKTRPVVPPRSKEQLQFLFNDFNAAFHAWKSQDLGVLLDVMIGSFVNLDLILQTTKDDVDGNVAEEYLQAVRQEQIKLLARLKRLAGPEEALKRVRNAVRKARKERALQQKNQGTNHVPRGISDRETDVSMPTVEPLTPPATPPRDQLLSENRGASFVSRLGETMTVLPTNREIAHEMQINGTFEVQQQPWTDSRKLSMNSLRHSMRESMQQGEIQVASSWTHAMAVLLRDKLLSMLSQRHPLYDRIDGFLDPKLIEQQARKHVFSYESFFETIGNLIAQICSPGRDAAVRSFIADMTSDTIDKLFALIDIIDLMTLDHINFQFRMASRSVIEHGHEHEFNLFRKDLQDGKHNLDHASRWWTSAKSSLPSSTTTHAACGNAIYSRGLVDLVLSNLPLKYDDLPETLQLDWIRLLDLRAKAFHMVAIASVLLTTKIRLRRNREALWAKDAERLMSLDLLNCDAARVVALIESSHMMPDSTKEGLLNFVNRVLPSAAAATQKAKTAGQARLEATQQWKSWNPSSFTSTSTNFNNDMFTEQIATFILKSLREHIFARSSASSTAERVRVTTSASEILARAGMPEFVADVGTLVDMLERIKSVDLKAHGKWYDEIASTVADGSSE